MRMKEKRKLSDEALHPSSFIPHPSNWRVFCALAIPPEVGGRVSEHVNKLRQSFPEVRASWNRDDKFHLTLKFLGGIAQARVESLSSAAERATHGLTPFKLIVAGPGVFPKSGPPKVLWIGISDVDGRLIELHSRLEDECREEGFPKETRWFHPHLTLARLRHSQGARELARLHRETDFSPIGFIASELFVIRSELGPGGSHYSEISRHKLGAVNSAGDEFAS
jgi:RNA 2',3'-cyclic 3'-phosphodiesterase